MCGQRQLLQFAGLVAGVCLFVGAVTADDRAGVIRDQRWSIQFRSKSGAVRSENLDVSRFRKSNITPAVFQQAAPATESVKPIDSVQPAPEPAPVLVNPDAPKPETTTDRVGNPLELVPSVVSPSIMTYTEAYAAVPFSRTEYEANPQYRHQAALELMFRTLRPTTLVQNYTPRAFRYPDSYQIPYGRSDTQHINIRHFGGTSYNGQSPFGYPYGLKGNW